MNFPRVIKIWNWIRLKLILFSYIPILYITVVVVCVYNRLYHVKLCFAIFSRFHKPRNINIFHKHNHKHLKNKPRNRHIIEPTFMYFISNQFIIVIPYSITSLGKTICDEVILGNISLPTNLSNQTLLGMLQ